MARRPAFSVDARIANTGTDRGGEPLADVHVERRGKTFAELSIRIVLSMIDIHTARDADEDVVEETVGFIGPAHNPILFVAVAVFLCHDTCCDQCQRGGQKTFHKLSFHGVSVL